MVSADFDLKRAVQSAGGAGRRAAFAEWQRTLWGPLTF
jgi:hypothetical protein